MAESDKCRRYPDILLAHDYAVVDCRESVYGKWHCDGTELRLAEYAYPHSARMRPKVMTRSRWPALKLWKCVRTLYKMVTLTSRQNPSNTQYLPLAIWSP